MGRRRKGYIMELYFNVKRIMIYVRTLNSVLKRSEPFISISRETAFSETHELLHHL